MEFFTIGVYNSTEEDFFGKLQAANIDTFCDIRQRRGVRGAKYAFVNSRRLQDRLASLGVRYMHHKDLAPSAEIRDLQRSVDAKQRLAKRSRQTLGETFREAYRDRVLASFDFNLFLQDLEEQKSRRVALFCVEECADACHRSLVARKLESINGRKIKDL